jgi:cation:H+ antiporter
VYLKARIFNYTVLKIFNMTATVLIFLAALSVLLLAARFFTVAAEKIGAWMRLPSFVVGIFIVGIGTSLPELISGILSVQKGVSEILPGNIIGANISNILLITGLAAVLNRKSIHLSANYIYIDLHFLSGSVFYFLVIAYDGMISFAEAAIGILIFIVYTVYLIRGEGNKTNETDVSFKQKDSFPFRQLVILTVAGVGIYLGADYTIYSLEKIAIAMRVPSSVIALTLLSLGTTLPELAVNISAIRQGKAEMAVGNVLGSSVFNTLVIPPVASLIGTIQVPSTLTGFALPVMAACGLLFYLLTQDKRISIWEGWMFICLYILFILKTVGV